MNNTEKGIIIVMLILSLLVGICFGYIQGNYNGFEQSYEKFKEIPPVGCYCIKVPKTDSIFNTLPLPNLTK